jgi:hypothetical protein
MVACQERRRDSVKERVKRVCVCAACGRGGVACFWDARAGSSMVISAPSDTKESTGRSRLRSVAARMLATCGLYTVRMPDAVSAGAEMAGSLSSRRGSERSASTSWATVVAGGMVRCTVCRWHTAQPGWISWHMVLAKMPSAPWACVDEAGQG